MSALRVCNLKVRRGARLVLEDVSFDVEAGTVLALLGRNGAGKSTLLSSMAGLVTPERGEVLVGGESLARLSRREVARRLASLGQAERPDDDLSSLEVVLLGRAPHLGAWGLPSDSDVELALEALRGVDAELFASRPIGTLSGGERQRVLLARLLCQSGNVLLLDEPTDALDPAHALHAMQLLVRRAQAGAAVVVVLHDLTLAARFAHQCVVLSSGRVLASGDVEATLSPQVLGEAFGVPMRLHHVEGRPVVLAD